MEDNLKHEEAVNSSDIDQNVSDQSSATDDMGHAQGTEGDSANLQNEIDAWKDKYLRLVADFDNYKKRTSKERLDLIQTAGQEVITSLLDVLDDSERAEKQMMESEDVQQIREGVNLVFSKLRQTLANQGLKPFESVGKDFDVDTQDAITEIPAPSPDQVGKVIDEVQKGYHLGDKLIRHAKVVVGK